MPHDYCDPNSAWMPPLLPREASGNIRVAEDVAERLSGMTGRNPLFLPAMKRLLSVLAILIALPVAADEPFTFKVIGIDCAACAPPIVKALSAVPGVSRPTIDAKNQTATVFLAPGADREKVRAAVRNA